MNKDQLAEANDEDVSEDILEDEVESDELEAEIEEVEADETDEQDEPDEATEEEAEEGLVVTLGDEEDEEEDTQPFRELRQQNRDLKRELRELKSAKKAEVVEELGEKPQLKDFDYDADKFETALLQWSERKREIEAKANAEAEQNAKLAEEYQEKVARYRASAKSLKVKDFDEAEEVVKEVLPKVLQSIIIDNAKQSHLLTYALGKNPQIMESLPKGETFRDAVAAAYQLGVIESGLKVTGMKNKPKPEGRISGGAKPLRSGERHLEKLREEASRTGDYTKVTAYKKKMRAK